MSLKFADIGEISLASSAFLLALWTHYCSYGSRSIDNIPAKTAAVAFEIVQYVEVILNVGRLWTASNSRRRYLLYNTFSAQTDAE